MCKIADVVLKRRCELLSFFTIIFAVFFLDDLAYATKFHCKRVHLQQSYDVMSIFKIAVIELQIYYRPQF